MIRFRAATLGLTLVGLAFLLPSQLIAYTGEKLAKGAKVSIDQARAIALKAKPGTISDEELEREVFAIPSPSRAAVTFMKSEWMHRRARF